MAAYYKYKYLVLGAWGCGAFSNDAKIVSKPYFKALEEVKYSDIYLKDLFKEIYFAVLSRSADNYNAFAEYFGKGKADINFFDGKNEAKGNLIKTGKGIFGAVAGAGDKIKNGDAAGKIAGMAGGSAKSLTAGAKSVGSGAKKAVEAMANQPVFDRLNKKKESLDALLKEAVDEYNIAYTLMSDSGSGMAWWRYIGCRRRRNGGRTGIACHGRSHRVEYCRGKSTYLNYAF